MTADDLRRLWRRRCDPAALRESERNDRIALQVLAYLIRRGVIAGVITRS